MIYILRFTHEVVPDKHKMGQGQREREREREYTQKAVSHLWSEMQDFDHCWSEVSKIHNLLLSTEYIIQLFDTNHYQIRASSEQSQISILGDCGKGVLAMLVTVVIQRI